MAEDQSQPKSRSPLEEKQCRICLDGVDAEQQLGRLISPCNCKGSIRYVHVKCLQKWRKVSVSRSAFFACPQCHYQYRFARTRVVGLATNPIMIAGISSTIFISIVMLASFVTTFFISLFEEPSYYRWSFFHIVSPFEVAQDLITAAFRILRDGDVAGILEDNIFSDGAPRGSSAGTRTNPLGRRSKPGFVMRFVRRFVLGLPLVGAASLVQLLLSFQVLAPVQLLARYRASRRRNNTRDIAALIVIGLIMLGALRALYKVYQTTESYTKRLLLRAEDAILEVNT